MYKRPNRRERPWLSGRVGSPGKKKHHFNAAGDYFIKLRLTAPREKTKLRHDNIGKKRGE